MNQAVLKPFGKQHLEATCEWLNRPDLARLTGTVYPVQYAGQIKWREAIMRDPLRKFFAIETPDGVHIGNTGIKKLDPENRGAELFAYIGDPDRRGRGAGTEATKTLCRLCFGKLNLHRLFVTVFAYNAPALASYERAGFKKEAVLREHLYRSGRYHNVILLANTNHA